ncbi:hypothetical protein KIW84_031237 [Lathyrus oleraceus]|uniref:Uncharacterized protein n=1 Tax=Pisum sativum TaxID=3888 RepID=A0A9D4XSL5_PEA|nr:hypothetical protein KIW84_031237 [Pisum sativum]
MKSAQDYAARVDNFWSYATISKDIIHRWTYSLVPDIMNFGNTTTKLERQGIYHGSEVSQSQSAVVGPFFVIGSGTKIGQNTNILNSVVGGDLAPVTEDKIVEVVKAMEDELELIHDGNTLPPSRELIPNANDSDGDHNDDSRDDFDKEFEANFFRVVHENIQDVHFDFRNQLFEVVVR